MSETKQDYVVVVCDTESRDNGTVRYLDDGSSFPPKWTLDEVTALRFSKYDDAVQYLKAHGKTVSALSYYVVPVEP